MGMVGLIVVEKFQFEVVQNFEKNPDSDDICLLLGRFPLCSFHMDKVQFCRIRVQTSESVG